MRSLKLTYDASCVDKEMINTLGQRLAPIIESMKQARTQGYETDYAALNLASDTETLKHVDALIEKVSHYAPTMVVVVGIGGSNLGTVALVEALYGTFHNDFYCPTFYYADTIDNTRDKYLLERAERELKKGNAILVVIVTKSGKTTETLINGALYRELLKKYYPQDYRNFIVVITDKGSPLEAIAHQQGYAMLEIPQRVGGRYSVLSAVGLFPLRLLKVDCKELLAGADAILTECLNENIFENNAALSAAVIYAHYKNGHTIHDTFVFLPDLFMLGAWYKQLVGESLGKSQSISGQHVEIGITPTVSVGTTDLHSVAQLYLGGPRDKITTFIFQQCEAETLTIPNNEFIHPLPFLQGRSVSSVKEAIYHGVLTAYKNGRRPYMTLAVQDLTPFTLGSFIMMKMCEVLYLAALLEVNPFDQPAVELYKEETRRILQA
jgi:glucose-6-phosphate isomerase